MAKLDRVEISLQLSDILKKVREYNAWVKETTSNSDSYAFSEGYYCGRVEVALQLLAEAFDIEL